MPTIMPMIDLDYFFLRNVGQLGVGAPPVHELGMLAVEHGAQLLG